MSKAIRVLLVVWGSVMSICTLVLMHDVRVLRDVARAEADLIDTRDGFYKTLFLREAEAIDQLSTEVDLEHKIIETMQAEQDLRDHMPKGKVKGTSL